MGRGGGPVDSVRVGGGLDLKGRGTVLFHGDNIFSSQKTIGDFQPIGNLPWDFSWDLVREGGLVSIFEREGVLRPLLA